MEVLDLFSGIGGFSLGLERAGLKTTAFCEIDNECREVLKKHWPEVLKFKDIRDLRPQEGDYDIVCGGFPCQDISVGGSQKGIIKGNRSSLWKEFKRIINEVKPRYAIIENVERLRKNGLGIVLNDLSAIGYNAEWHCITADSVGLPHQRDRLFIIAYPCRERLDKCTGEARHLQIDKKRKGKALYPDREKRQLEPGEIRTILSPRSIKDFQDSQTDKRASISKLRRVTNGVPFGLDERKRKQRIKQLGNAVIPQIAELIGGEIIKYEISRQGD